VLSSGLLGAQTTTESNAKETKQTTRRSMPADVQALRDTLNSQQGTIAQQQEQIESLRQQMQKMQEMIQQQQNSVQQSDSKAASARIAGEQQQQSLNQVKYDVADLKTAVTSTAVSVPEEQQKQNDSPLSFHIGSAYITPVGVADFTSVA
jgi:predicted nuclease with TOPRIM domain